MKKSLILFAALMLCGQHLMLCGQQMFADELSTLTVLSSDSTMGIGYGSGRWDKMAWTDIYAIPQKGYYFAGWDDGNEYNPRHICVDEVEKVVTAFFAEVDCDEGEDIDIPAEGLSFMVDGIMYQVISEEDSTVEVVANNESYSGEIKLPASVTYEGKTYSVTSIGEMAFCRCANLISVEIPASVSAIGRVAFAGCANLKSVTFAPGSQLSRIMEETFVDCTSLTSINIPATVVSIENHAFRNCRSLTSVAIPNSVITIGNSAFTKTGLTSVEIPASVSAIGMCAFKDCRNLTSVTFASNSRLSIISEQTFFGCIGLTSIHIPASVVAIGTFAFSGCKGLASVTFNGIACQKTIANNAFSLVGSETTPVSLFLPENWAEENRPKSNQIRWRGGYFNTTIIKLEPYKTEAKAAITQAAGDFSGSEALQDVVNYYLTAIDNANSIDAINALKEEALEALPAYLATYEDGQTIGYMHGFDSGHDIGFGEGEAVGYLDALNDLTFDLPTDPEGTPGHTVTITKGEKTLILVNPDKVTFGKQE